MPKLYFRIQSDYDKVVKLREEIKRLKVELSSIDSNKYKNAAEQVNHKINESTKELKSLTEQAAKNASVMDGAFKTKIYNSSKAVNELTLKIIQQKSVLKGIEGDISKMKIAYDKLGHFSPKRNEMLKEMNSAKIALNEEKAALFGLQTQQSMAKLKTKELRDEYSLYNKNANEMTATTEKVGFSLSKAFAVVGGIALAKQLVNQIITIRGQFRSMEIGMNTMLGEEKGGKLTSEVKDYARESPLNLKDIMAGTQTMVGFNLEAEKVPRYIRAIGDISQGNSQKFNSLTLAFSQMSATGKLMGQDLLQMINAGFNPLSIMAEKAGKSIGELKGEMSKGAISAEMVQQAFIDATSAGGKFFNMSKNASKEIEGQLSMLGDSIDRSLNEMGANSEGIIMAGIKGTTALVDNYEIVGKTLLGLVGTYGAYRVAVTLSTLATSKHTIAEILLTNVRAIARRAQMALNASMLSNPYVAVTLALGLLVTTMWALHDSTTSAERAQERFNKRQEDNNKLAEENKRKLEQLISAINDETTAEFERIKLMEELKSLYPSIFQKYIDEKGHITDLTNLWKQYNEEVSKRAINQSKVDKKEVQGKITEKETELKKLESPLGNTLKSQGGTNERERELKKEIEVLYGELYLTAAKEREDNFIMWKADIKDKTDKEIAIELKEYERYKESVNKPFGNSFQSSNNLQPYNNPALVSGIDSKELKKRMEAIEQEQQARSKKVIKSFSAQVKDAQNVVTKLQSELTDLRSGKGEHEDFIKIIEEKQKALKEAESKLSTLIGKKKENVAKNETPVFTLKNEILKMENEKSKAEISKMREGFDKKRALLEQQQKEELQQVDAWYNAQVSLVMAYQEKLYIAKNGSAKGFKFDSSSEQMQTLDSMKTSKDASAKERGAQGLEAILQDELNKYKGYYEQRKELENKYNSEYNLISAAKNGDNDEIIDAKLNELELKKTETLDALDMQFASREETFTVWCNSLVNMCLSELEEALSTAKQELDKIDKNGGSSQDVAKARAKVTKAQSSLKNKKTEVESSSDSAKKHARQIKQWDMLRNSLSKTEKEFNTIGDAIGGTAGEALKAVGGISTSTVSMINSIVTLTTTSSLSMSGVSKSAETAIKTVESASVILAIISAAMQIVMKLASIFGKQKQLSEETIGNYNALMDVTDKLIDEQKELLKTLSGVQALIASEEAVKMIKKQIEATKILGKEYLNTGQSMGSHSYGYRDKEKLEAYRKQLKAIGIDLDKMGDRLEGVFDLDAETLKKWQQDSYESWAKLGDDTRKYLQEIIDANEKIQEISDATSEALTEMTFDDAKKSLKDLLLDVDTTMSDVADNFQDKMREAIVRNIIDGELGVQIKNWYKNFTAAMGGGLTNDEMKSLREEYVNIFQNAQDMKDAAFEAAGITQTSNQKGSSGGYETMSQETGSELNGRFTDLQMKGARIEEQNNIQTDILRSVLLKGEMICASNYEIRDIGDEVRDILVSTYMEIISIRENTDKMIPILGGMSDNINSMKNDGIKTK